MIKQQKEVGSLFVKIRMNAQEVEQLKKMQRQGTERSISNYVRKMALQQPVIIKYRNASADDLLEEVIVLKKELQAIGHNLAQVVHKLHMLDTIAEFRMWIKLYEGLNHSLTQKVEEIRTKVSKLYEQWSQK